MALYGIVDKRYSVSLSSAPRGPRPEDMAILMRDDRGQARRMRFISKTNLPRMTNSERGKFYRQRHHDYEVQLTRDVQRLQGQVHNLRRMRELRGILPRQYPSIDPDLVQSAIQVVYDVLIRRQEGCVPVNQGLFGGSCAAEVSGYPPPAQQMQAQEGPQLCPSQSQLFIARHNKTSTPLVFKLDAIEIQGCADSRIIVARGCLCAQYRRTELGLLFPKIRHDKHLAARLLEGEVVYDCTYRFHIAGSLGLKSLAFASVDMDMVGGLLALIPSLHCVRALLDPLIISESSSAKAKASSTEPHNSYTCAVLADGVVRAEGVPSEKQVYTSSQIPMRSMVLSTILNEDEETRPELVH